MILCDNIIENNSIILENLDTNSSTEWTTPSPSYGFYTINYAKPLIVGNIYYARCKYKFTTTNQSPTWVTIYSQGGSGVFDYCRLDNPTAGVEYTISGITNNVIVDNARKLKSGTIYNGNNNKIDGVKAQTKDVLVYDVTALYYFLLSLSKVNDIQSMKTWCDNNLEYKSYGVKYDLYELLSDCNKVVFKNGNTVGEIIETDGMEIYSVSDKLRNNTYFDTETSVYVYNNNGNGAVTFERIDAKTQDSPFYPEHKYVLKITTNGTANPHCGGFYASHTSAANKIFIEKFVAKVPVGYNITSAFNSQGDGAIITYLTPREGTGKWEEYTILYKCGSTGEFSTGGHVYLTPISSSYSSTSVTWYLAYVNNCDITENEELKNYTALNNKDIIKSNKIFTKKYDETNLVPNGDGSDTNMPLPTGWVWDTTDVAGNAKASIVANIGSASDVIQFDKFKIKPTCKYKISFWVKCKADMTNFLTAIQYYEQSGSNFFQLKAPYVFYKPNTLTALSADLNPGDTTVSVKSTANWSAETGYYSLAFRTSNWIYKSYHDLGIWFNPNGLNLGVIAAVTNSTTLSLKTPYTGPKQVSGTRICYGKDASTYVYPVGKYDLPTDNTWKYVEGYFGEENVIWDGATDSGWKGIPYSATHASLILSLYSNDGTVPLKFADIRIEEISATGNGRQENKIQFKKFNN